MTSNQQNSGIIKKLYKTREYVLEQLKTQGYDVSDHDEFSINEIHAMFQNKQLDMLVENVDTNKKTYIKYHINSGLRPQNIHDIIDELYHLEQHISHEDTLIIIAKDPPNDTLINLLEQLYADDNIYIIIFGISQLQFNVLNHAMVPKHEKLTSDQVVELKKRYNIQKESEFPTISRFDPVAQAIGLRPNEICHIVRPSKTATTSNYYRLCLNN